MTPEEKEKLKQRRLENLRKGREKKKNATPEATKPESVGGGTPPSAPPPIDPGPVPPLTDAPPPFVGGPTGPSAAGLIDPKQAKSIGRIANSYFKGATKGIALLAPKNLEISIEELDEAEAELLGSFAIPVIEKWLPKWKDSPEYALAVVAVGIYLGKIKVKKKDPGLNLGGLVPKVEPAPAEPIPEVKTRGLNLGNLEPIA